MNAHQQHHHHGHVHLGEADWQAQLAQTELEGEVLLGFVTAAAEVIADHRPVDEIRRVLDVGSGPGVGTCELARCFPSAVVTALDPTAASLDRAQSRARTLGLADRVTTVVAELPDGLDGLGPFDVIWASMSLHHVGDEVDALRRLGALLSPGGVLAVVEFGGDTRYLPRDLGIGNPDLSARLEAVQSAWFAEMRAGLAGSADSAPLPDMVATAGLIVRHHELLVEHFDAPLDDTRRRFVQGSLRRGLDWFGERLDEHDREALRQLVDPDDARGALDRDNLYIHVERQLLLASNPA